MGIYDASLGARSNETSGVAINARKRKGDVSTFNYVDNLSRAIRHAGRILVDMIPHVYSKERIIRVIYQDGESDEVPINQSFPVQPGQPLPGQPNKTPNPQDQAEIAEFDAGLMQIYDLDGGEVRRDLRSRPELHDAERRSRGADDRVRALLPGSRSR